MPLIWLCQPKSQTFTIRGVSGAQICALEQKWAFSKMMESVPWFQVLWLRCSFTVLGNLSRAAPLPKRRKQASLSLWGWHWEEGLFLRVGQWEPEGHPSRTDGHVQEMPKGKSARVELSALCCMLSCLQGGGLDCVIMTDDKNLWILFCRLILFNNSDPFYLPPNKI